MKIMVPEFLLVIAVTISFHPSVGYTISNGTEYYDSYDTDQPSVPSYNDTLLGELVDSPYVNYRGKNWRYSFSEDVDTDKNGILSEEEIIQNVKSGMELIFRLLDKNVDGVVNKEELSSPSLDINNVNELAGIYFDMSPDRYYWTYYDLMQMRSLDNNKDAFLTIDEIENSIEVNTVMQKKIIRELFNYFDENKDDKLSLDDFKPKLKKVMEMVFKLYDQNNDGFLSMDDLDFKIQWNDITSILDLFKQEYMQNEAINVNYFLVPFNLDLNGDSIINSLDLYLSADYFFRYGDEELAMISKVIKLLDQDQNGIYTFDEIKNFVVAVWNILDANHDMNISLEDGYILLQNKFGVDSDKISALKDYVKYVQSFMKEEALNFVDYLIHTIDRNKNKEINIQEVFQMPELCFGRWSDESCFQTQRFPEPPTTLESDKFFPSSMYIQDSRYRQWDIRLMAFVNSALDSPTFYNIGEFDWSGAAEIEAKIESLAPKGEVLMDKLRHKISSYKQVISYLNGQDEQNIIKEY